MDQFSGGRSKGTGTLRVSTHRFRDPTGASDALAYFTDVALDNGLSESSQPDSIGDEVRFLIGTDSSGNWAAVAFRVGAIVVGVTGFSENDDPMPETLALAEEVAARASYWFAVQNGTTLGAWDRRADCRPDAPADSAAMMRDCADSPSLFALAPAPGLPVRVARRGADRRRLGTGPAARGE